MEHLVNAINQHTSQDAAYQHDIRFLIQKFEFGNIRYLIELIGDDAQCKIKSSQQGVGIERAVDLTLRHLSGYSQIDGNEYDYLPQQPAGFQLDEIRIQVFEYEVEEKYIAQEP